MRGQMKIQTNDNLYDLLNKAQELAKEPKLANVVYKKNLEEENLYDLDLEIRLQDPLNQEENQTINTCSCGCQFPTPRCGK